MLFIYEHKTDGNVTLMNKMQATLLTTKSAKLCFLYQFRIAGYAADAIKGARLTV